MTAPLAPPAPPAEPEGPGKLEGLGVVSSYDDLGTALDSGDGYEIAFAAAGAALDTLGFVADPFGALLEAGVGWIIEHVWFLNEPLDFLAGDPWTVQAQAQSWHDAAVGLAAAAETQHGFAMPGPPGSGSAAGWAGAAGTAYRRTAAERAECMAEVARKADQLAGVLIKTGALIGVARSLVRDLIAEFIAGVIKRALASVVLAPVSGGIAVAVWLGSVIADAIALANRIAEHIARLLRAAADAGHAASGLAAGILEAARRTSYTAGVLNAGAGPIDEFLDVSGVPEIVEVGKQDSTATLD